MTAWPGLTHELVQTLADGWLQAVDRLDSLKVMDLETRRSAGRLGAAAMVEFFEAIGCPGPEIPAACNTVFARVHRMLELRDLLNQEPDGRA